MSEQEMWAVFLELHTDNPREGPGNFESTKKAFTLLSDLPQIPDILDVGCGPGKQTMDLSRLTGGRIVAVDNHAPFIDDLTRKIEAAGLAHRIKPMLGDMKNLSFDAGCFDLIWAEASIYNIGFVKGLRCWKPLLRPGGYLVVSEAVWLQSEIPAVCREFWDAEYPAMMDIHGNVRAIRDAEYEWVDHFLLPESAWWEYYDPIKEKLPAIREKYGDDPVARSVIDREEHEMEIYRKYSSYYGYAFFIMRSV